MKSFLSLGIFLLLTAQLFAVEPPRSYPTGRYSDLHRNSIVTDKPVIEEGPEPTNDLDDWVLVNSKKTQSGISVTVINTKDQSQRVNVPSPEATQLGLAILELKQDNGNFLRSEARLQKGRFKGWVKYDTKFLALKKGAPAAKRKTAKGRKPAVPGRKTNVPPIPGLPGAAKSNNTKKPAGKRRSRVRFVPKPKK